MRQEGRSDRAGREEGRGHRRAGTRHRRNQGHRRGGLRLRLPDGRRLQGDVRVQHRQDLVAVQGGVQPDLERRARSSRRRTRRSPTPNSDTPYSMVQADLRAEPMVLCVPEVDKKRYYSVQLADLYTFNYGYIGSRATGSDAGCYLVAGPRWQGEKPDGHRQGVPFRDRLQPDHLSHAALQPGRHRQRQEDPGRLHGADAVGVPRSSRRRRRHRPSTSRSSSATTPSRPISRPTWTSCCSSPRRRCGGGGRAAARQVRQHRHRPGQEVRLQGPVGRAQGGGRPRHQGRLREDQASGATRSARTSTAGRSAAALRRPRLLQGRLAAARRRGQGRHLRQRCGRGDVPADAQRRRGPAARRQRSTATR